MKNKNKRETGVIDLNNVYEYIVALLFVLTTGTMVWFHVLGAAKSYIILLIVALWVFYKRKRYITYSHSLGYCVFVTVYFLLNIYVINRSPIIENICLGYIVVSFACLLIVGSRNIYEFRDKLTVVLAVINGWGLIVYNLYELGVMDPLSYIVQFPGGRSYTICLGISIGWPYFFERYAGIWHEPGAGQISSMFILILHFREISLWKWKNNKQKLCVFILLLAVLFSKSTTAYLLVICIVSFVALKAGGENNGIVGVVLKILLVILGAFVVSVIFNSDIIQEKLFSDDNMSKESRSIENLTLFNIFLDNPIFGAGLGTSNQWSDLIRFGAAGCSNGLLFFVSGLGIIWLIGFLLCLIKSVWKIRHVVPFPLVLIVFFVEICSQRYMEMPMTFLFLFSFGSYKMPKYLIDDDVLKRIQQKIKEKKFCVKN